MRGCDPSVGQGELQRLDQGAIQHLRRTGRGCWHEIDPIGEETALLRGCGQRQACLADAARAYQGQQPAGGIDQAWRRCGPARPCGRPTASVAWAGWNRHGPRRCRRGCASTTRSSRPRVWRPAPGRGSAADIVLGQGGAALAVQRQRLHQLAVGLFVPGFQRQQLAGVALGCGMVAQAQGGAA